VGIVISSYPYEVELGCLPKDGEVDPFVVMSVMILLLPLFLLRQWVPLEQSRLRGQWMLRKLRVIHGPVGKKPSTLALNWKNPFLFLLSL